MQYGADINNVCFGKSIGELIEKNMPQLKPESITRLRDVAMPAIGVLDRMKDLIEMAALETGDMTNVSRLQYFSEFKVLVREANPKNLVIISCQIFNARCHSRYHGAISV